MLEPINYYGPSTPSPTPWFTPSSLSYQFRGSDPWRDYVDLGHDDDRWARVLFAPKPPYPDDPYDPGLQVIRNRAVTMPRKELPRTRHGELESYGYMTPQNPGIFLSLEQTTYEPPTPVGPLEALRTGLRRLFGG